MEPHPVDREAGTGDERYRALLAERQGLRQRIQRLQDALRRERARVRLLEKAAPCPGCGDTRVAYHLQVHGQYGLFNLGRCSDCGLVFLLDDRGEFKDEIICNARVENMAHGLLAARNESASPNDGLHEAYQRERHLAFSTLARRVFEQRKAGRILDVGCGDGYFLSFFPEGPWQRIGIDYNPENIAKARARGLEVFEGSWEAFPEEGSFDVITMIEFIEHVERPADLLRWARRRIREEGLLVIQTGNVASREARAAGEKWAYLEAAPDHCVFFSPETLSRVLRRSGFVPAYAGPGVEEVMTFLARPGPEEQTASGPPAQSRPGRGGAEAPAAHGPGADPRDPFLEDLQRKHARHCDYLRGIIQRKDREIDRLRRAVASLQGKGRASAGQAGREGGKGDE